jgi:hypothetical protein
MPKTNGTKRGGATGALSPLPKPHTDMTPLDMPCQCDDSPSGMKRYQCLVCIRSYAYGVGFEQCYVDADKLASYSKIAAERLREVADDMKHQRRLGKDD